MMKDAPTKLGNTKYTKESSLVPHFLPSNMENTHNARLFVRFYYLLTIVTCSRKQNILIGSYNWIVISKFL